MDGRKLFQNESLRSKALRAHARKSMRPDPAAGRRSTGILARFWMRLSALAR